MQVLSHYRDDACIPLGQRRGISDLARFSLDLNGARADSASAAHSGGYPSPPMSGSPPLPPKVTQEAAHRHQGLYQTTAQDGTYRGIPATEGDARLHQPTALTRPSPVVRPTIGGELQGRMHFPFPRPESMAPRSLSYPPQLNHVPRPAAPSYLPPLTTGLSPSSASQSYPVAAQPPPVEGSSQQQTSPKTQRKTKGHVASACVPCKRAHLRHVFFFLFWGGCFSLLFLLVTWEHVSLHDRLPLFLPLAPFFLWDFLPCVLISSSASSLLREKQDIA